jgi:hypothetical protein
MNPKDSSDPFKIYWKNTTSIPLYFISPPKGARLYLPDSLGKMRQGKQGGSLHRNKTMPQLPKDKTSH